jgi:hypothetical protein
MEMSMSAMVASPRSYMAIACASAGTSSLQGRGNGSGGHVSYTYHASTHPINHSTVSLKRI